MKGIEKISDGWRLKGGKVLLDIEKTTGDMKCITISGDKKFVWTPDKGGVSICDDLTGKRYTGKDVKTVRFEIKEDP